MPFPDVAAHANWFCVGQAAASNKINSDKAAKENIHARTRAQTTPPKKRTRTHNNEQPTATDESHSPPKPSAAGSNPHPPPPPRQLQMIISTENAIHTTHAVYEGSASGQRPKNYRTNNGDNNRKRQQRQRQQLEQQRQQPLQAACSVRGRHLHASKHLPNSRFLHSGS
jgi:hypothetical protein